MTGQRRTIYEAGALENLTANLPPGSSILVKCMAEFFGTGVILFMGCMGGTSVNDDATLKPELSFGFAVMGAIIMFGHISNAHFNPAVTICSVIYGTLPILLAPFYIFAQYAGALAGFALMQFLIPNDFLKIDEGGICKTTLHESVSPVAGLAIEFFATSILILLVCAVWDERNAHIADSVPLKFAFVIVGISCVAGKYTGASLNPARTFGPAFVNNDWSDHWVFILGPCLAAFVMTTGYVFIFGTREPNSTPIGTDDEKFQLNQVQPLHQEKLAAHI